QGTGKEGRRRRRRPRSRRRVSGAQRNRDTLSRFCPPGRRAHPRRTASRGGLRPLATFQEFEVPMEITASLVKELRERTGAGMMECKKALTENNGDIDAAAEALRKSGLAKA